MKVPLMVRIGALVLATTAFYGYVGQMVPQKEVQPPQETALGGNMTTADMVKVGREIMEGKGLCVTCHTIGKTGALRFPDLEGIGSRAKSRVPGLSDVEYLAQTLYEPTAFVVPGFPPAMPAVNKPPIGLNDQEILCVIAYLQTLGGTATVTLETKHHYNGAAAAPAGTPAPAAPSPGEKQPLVDPKKGAQLGPAVSTPDAVTIANAGDNGPGAPQAGVTAARSVRGGVEARPAGSERGNGAPASDGDGGSGGAKPPGQAR
jgi:cytochrome c